MSKLLVDIAPLREFPVYRRIWLGYGLSGIGSQMTTFAVALQVWTMTHSSVAVGGVGLASALPTVAFGLLGGSVADAVDRRRLVMFTNSALGVVSALLTAQAFAGVRSVPLVYALVTAQSLLSSMGAPARQSLLAKLLPPERVPAGAALNMLSMHATVTFGPALAGAVAAVWGLKVCYTVDAVSFAAALYGIFGLPSMPPAAGARAGLRAVGEGLSFIRGNRVVLGALLSDVNATLLGMPFALFPAINAAHFGGSPPTLGLLTSAVAVGGIVGSALSGPVGRVRRPGRAMLAAIVLWGAALALFGLATSLWVALGLLLVAGVADVVSVVLRTSVVQLATPDALRGRVSAAEYVVGAGCPQLGNFRGGLVAQLTSPAISAVSGGLSVIAGVALIRLFLPALARHTTAGPTQPTAPEPATVAAPVPAAEAPLGDDTRVATG